VRVLLSAFLDVPSDQGITLSGEIPVDASEIAEAAGKQDGDLLITKRHWGAFAHTEPEQVLFDRGVETVVLAGIATNLGVESTLRQGTGLAFTDLHRENRNTKKATRWLLRDPGVSTIPLTAPTLSIFRWNDGFRRVATQYSAERAILCLQRDTRPLTAIMSP
jgi:hypothetical protein